MTLTDDELKKRIEECQQKSKRAVTKELSASYARMGAEWRKLYRQRLERNLSEGVRAALDEPLAHVTESSDGQAPCSDT
jgi:vacuolar-type H+-ATPase subunit E/Vma4